LGYDFEMARRRKHVQQEMLTKDGTRPKSKKGGVRRRAGRPPKGERAGAPHDERPTLNANEPIHVVLRVLAIVGVLRNRHIYQALRHATLVAAKWDAFHIVHVSIQHDHIHLLVEATNKDALAKGMQSFQISAAKQINRTIGRRLRTKRRGKVFADRYYAEIVSSPRQARHALSYVLNNWRKHREDRGAVTERWSVDPYSTGVVFRDWKRGTPPIVAWDDHEPLIVWEPRTWLLREGWRRHGLIDWTEVPSANNGRKRSRTRTTSMVALEA
jgi:REP element-mobilizing transposase RayT